MTDSDPPRVPHNFSWPSLAYDQPPNTGDYVRVNMFFMKKKGISWEYFARHWQHVHADICVALKAFNETNLLHYSQFYQTPDDREKARKLFPNHCAMEWDACSEFWVRKLEDFAAFLASKEYRDTTRTY
jgi:hypothetical protein